MKITVFCIFNAQNSVRGIRPEKSRPALAKQCGPARTAVHTWALVSYKFAKTAGQGPWPTGMRV